MTRPNSLLTQKQIESKRATDRRRYHGDVDAAREKVSKWRRNNPDKAKEIRRKARVKHITKYRKANREYMKKFRAENPDVARQRDRDYKDRNREALKEKAKDYYERNRERIAVKCKHEVDELADHYVKCVLCSRSPLVHNDIPEQLVETKREHIRLRREIRNGNN